jgi:glycine betaine/proline transport system ATP-binding protein
MSDSFISNPTSNTSDVVVSFKQVDIIFGDDQARATKLLDDGGTRESILKETGAVLGVANANIDIHEGEICVLMGLSGSGKSTLLRAVNGLNKVTRGEVLVRHKEGHVDIASCDATTLREMRTSRIAMVFQQFALLPWRTVEENVGLGLELKGMDKQQRQTIVDEKLKLVDLFQWKTKYAHELSGGMQQRVGLARAFATDADILLMDEPFSALDPLIRTYLQDFLLDLQRDLKKTIIFVSHDLDEALKLGNHIAIMEGGHIVQYGEPEQIVLNPANDYVADFVAHMNPLNVLQGSSFMAPVDNLPHDDNGNILLDSQSRYKVKVDAEGMLVSATVDGQPIEILHCDETTDFEKMKPNVILSAPINLKMRWNIEARYHTGAPVLLVDNGKFTGIIGDDEIYRGILRQSIASET